jgi:hypothetical protein
VPCGPDCLAVLHTVAELARRLSAAYKCFRLTFGRRDPPLRMHLRQACDLISHRPAHLRMITLINGAWHFGEAAWDFDLDRIKRQIRAVATTSWPSSSPLFAIT